MSSFLLMSHPKICGILSLITSYFSSLKATVVVITKEMAMLLCYNCIFRINTLQTSISTGSSRTTWRLECGRCVSGWTDFVRPKIQVNSSFNLKIYFIVVLYKIMIKGGYKQLQTIMVQECQVPGQVCAFKKTKNNLWPYVPAYSLFKHRMAGNMSPGHLDFVAYFSTVFCLSAFI